MPGAPKRPSNAVQRFLRRLASHAGISTNSKRSSGSQSVDQSSKSLGAPDAREPSAPAATPRKTQATSWSSRSESSTIEVDISRIRQDMRVEVFGLLPDPIFRVDANEWAIVQQNFPAPLGYHFDPDDPDKTEAYGVAFDQGEGTLRVRVVPQYDYSANESTNPPTYRWATISALPRPVEIDSSWACLFAAQRELSNLFEIHEYISSRITEIKARVASVIRAKKMETPMLETSYILAQGYIPLEAVLGLTQDNWMEKGCYSEVMDDMCKIALLRELISPVSLLAMDPDAQWDCDTRRVQNAVYEAGARHAILGGHEAPTSGIPDYIMP
ncbi:hypothetical protein V8F33_006832 [Rhypophila sp. PSN 637]